MFLLDIPESRLAFLTGFLMWSDNLSYWSMVTARSLCVTSSSVWISVSLVVV